MTVLLVAPAAKSLAQIGCLDGGGFFPFLERCSGDTEPHGGAVIVTRTAQHVRFGSLADIPNTNRDVRFTPKSGRVQRRNRCPLSAKSGHQAFAAGLGCICPSNSASPFD